MGRNSIREKFKISSDLQQRFYKFRTSCKDGLIVNNIYNLSIKEFKEVINCSVIGLKEIGSNKWEVILDFIADTKNNTNILIVEKNNTYYKQLIHTI